MNVIDTTKWQQGPDFLGDDDEDTALLRSMYLSAKNYINKFQWASAVTESFLAFGIGGVIALFLMQFDRPIGSSDDKLWVVVGDLPYAYFVLDDAYDVASALQVYCELMSGWVDAVLSNKSLIDAFPISDPPTKANAEELKKRIEFIKANIIPTSNLTR